MHVTFILCRKKNKKIVSTFSSALDFDTFVFALDSKVEIIVPLDDRDYDLKNFSCKDLDGNIIIFSTAIIKQLRRYL